MKEKIAAENLPVHVIKLDLVDPPSIETAVSEIIARSGRIDALVNNAGIGGGRAVEETPLDEVREIFETNYFGNVTCTACGDTDHARQTVRQDRHRRLAGGPQW